MKALVVFESMWGNTEEIARAVAAGLAEQMEVTTFDVNWAPADPGPEFGLIVAGGPTHAFSMSRPGTRAEAHSRGAPFGDQGIGLRDWLDQLPPGRHTQMMATFDTRVGTVRHLPGAASKSAARDARRHGYPRAGHPESFYVEDMGGPLLVGESLRATAWAREIAAEAVGRTQTRRHQAQVRDERGSTT